MRNLIAVVLWAVLLSTALQIGKIWQSRLYPGPTVDAVISEDRLVRGKVVYDWSGASIVDEAGVKFRLDEQTAIETTAAPKISGSAWDVALVSWPGVVPSLFISALLLLYFRASK